jgi:hypothetical protein
LESLDPIQPKVKQTLSQISYLFDPAQDQLPNLIENLKLVLLEEPAPKFKDFRITIYKWNKSFVELDREEAWIGQTPLSDLALLSGYANPGLENGCFSIFDDVKSYIRPLSLWLAPVGFLIIPSEDGQFVEQQIKKHSFTFQKSLSELLMYRAKTKFTIEVLADLSERALIRDLVVTAAQIIVPLRWRIGADEHGDYANRLFADLKRESETLSLKLPNGDRVIYEMPPIVQYIDSWPCHWAYQEERLQNQKEALKADIEGFFTDWIKWHRALHKLIGEHNTWPKIAERVRNLESALNDIKTAIGVLSEQINTVSSRGTASDQNAYEFFHINGKNFKVTFAGAYISCLNSQACRIIHILLSNPGEEFDMYTLYLMTKHYDYEPGSEKSIWSKNIANALPGILVSASDLEKAKTKAEKDILKQELKTATSALRKIIKQADELGFGKKEVYTLEVHFQNQRGLLEEHFGPERDAGYDESDPVASTFEFKNLIPKKTWRERITKQMKKAQENLKKNDLSHFSRYLDDTIKRSEEKGVHYYTFRPKAASIPDYRAVEWKLYK